MKRLTTINKEAPNEFNVLALYGINFTIANDEFIIDRIPAKELLTLDGRWGVPVEYLDDHFRDPEELRHLSIAGIGVFVKNSSLRIRDEHQLKAWDIISAYYASVLEDHVIKHEEKLFKFVDRDTYLPLDGYRCEVVDLEDIGWGIRIFMGDEFVSGITGVSQSLAYAVLYGKDKVIEMNVSNLETGGTTLPSVDDLEGTTNKE